MDFYVELLTKYFKPRDIKRGFVDSSLLRIGDN